MADRKGMMEIEDVLSSIRRLVAADTRSGTAGAAPQPADAAERLVLTPAQRIDEGEAAAAQPAASAELPESLRAWDEDSRAEQGAAVDPPEDIEATLAALEAALDDDLSAEALPQPDDDRAAASVTRDALEGTAVVEAAEAVDAAEWTQAPDLTDPSGDEALLPEGDEALAFGAEGADEAGVADDVALTEDAAAPGPGDDLAASVPGDDAGASAPGHDAAASSPADDVGAPVPGDDVGAPVPGDDAAAPVPRGPLRGFIWEAGLEDGAVDDLPSVPEALAEGLADADAPGLADAQPDTDGMAESGGWAMPASGDDDWASAPVEAVEAAFDLPQDAGEPPGDEPAEAELAAAPDAALPAAAELPSADAAAAFGDAGAGLPPATPVPPPAAAAPAGLAPAGLSLDADPDGEEAELADLGLFEGDETLPLDEAALRDLVAEIIRDELRGALGARIARNLRQIVRQEIARELAARGLSDEG